ncbi:MAG: primosomal protein N' [SAR202 cluster bacterium]|nr:primosomal protein N' [SAR202 cluster bacterium]
MLFAEVAVDFPDERARTFTYKVPDALELAVGDLVWVPFGPRTLQGVVFEINTFESTGLQKIRSVNARTVGGPFISQDLIDVARWVAKYYRTTLFAACSLLLPPGASSRLRIWLSVGDSRGDFSKQEQRAFNYILKRGRATKSRVIRLLGKRGVSIVERMIRQRFIVAESEWQKPRVSAVFTSRIEMTASESQAKQLIDRFANSRSYRRAELLVWFQSGKIAQTKSALNSLFGVAAVNWAFDEKLLRIRKVRRDRDPLADHFFQQVFPHSPTVAQHAAIDQIVTQIQSGKLSDDPTGRRFLLHGVTGSGKTEVYLQSIEACIANGKKAIYLVPEIALTAQTLERIASRFPGKVALLHSGLTVGERYDQWWRVKQGDFQIILGSRGAIFSPVDNLGLIVIDEEHEWTYKQADQAPRYHARVVAERLSQQTGAVLVLGSATPDVSSYRSARSGRYQLLELPDRLGSQSEGRNLKLSSSLAETEIIDMRQERAEGHFDMLSRKLIDRMRDSLDEGGKVILFLNRRGSASFIQCVECGKVRECPRCDTSLTFHRDFDNARVRGAQLLCHYCNYRVRSDSVCPVCAGKQMRRSSPGTQMAAEAVRQWFPRTEVIRWDSDTARTARDHKRILNDFVQSDSGVLIGTQMVAKGLDIPTVTLVGVISADTGLAVPDFRAGERAFQVLTQVVGRSGRGVSDGRGLIQTFNPDHYAIQAAADQDYGLFYDIEIRMRASYANPPFTKIIKLTHSAADPSKAENEAKRMSEMLGNVRESYGETGVVVIGPTPAYPLKLRNMYRWQILIKGSHPDRLLELVPASSLWVVDIDPVMMG